MVGEKAKASQFFALLYLSLLSSVFMYISSPKVQIAKTETVLMPLFFIFFSLICSMPSFLVYKLYLKNKDSLQTIKKTSFLKWIAAFYGVASFMGALNTIARFDLFASSELFPGSDMTVFIVLIIFICGFLSLLGLGALSRGAGIFTFIVIIATSVVMLSLRSELDLLNFTPLFEDGLSDFINNSFFFSLQGAQIGAALLFLPEIEGNVKRNFILFIVLGGLSFSLLLFFVIGSLGAFSDTQIFPTYTAVSLASFGLIERMDALETAIWVLCVVEKISFYFLITIRSISYIFNNISNKRICLIISSLMGGVLTFVSSNVERFGFFSYVPLVGFLYLLVVIILPFSIYFYLRGKLYD